MADSAYRGSRVKGMAYAQKVFRALPEDMRATLNRAVEETATHLLSNAKRRLVPHRRYGFLERYLGMQMNEKSGVAKVGLPARIVLIVPRGVRASSGLRITQRIKRKDSRGRSKATYLILGSGSGSWLGGQKIRPSKYAHLVEYGHQRGRGKSKAPPYPFMIPSAEEQRQPCLGRVTAEVQRLEQALASKAPSMSSVGSRTV